MKTVINVIVLVMVLFVPVFSSHAGNALAIAAEQATQATSDAPFPGKKSIYHGFDRYDFTVDGMGVIVVCPKTPLPGKPWIWTAELVDVGFKPVELYAKAGIALLEKGFYLAAMGLGNNFGSPDSLKHWDVFYKAMTETYKFPKKPGMYGLSRQGLSIHRWAAANTDKVSGLYFDKAVCDFKSWPGGKGKGSGSPEDWKSLIKVYHFADEAEALAYKQNPIDLVKPIVDAKIPVLHVAGDKDTAVPYDENAAIVKQKMEALGGDITVIIKPGDDHHPHSLVDPKPIVDFFLRCTGQTAK